MAPAIIANITGHNLASAREPVSKTVTRIMNIKSEGVRGFEEEQVRSKVLDHFNLSISNN